MLLLLMLLLVGPSGTAAAAPAWVLPVPRPPQPTGFSERQLGEFVQQNIGHAFGVLLGVGPGNLALELLKTWPSGILFLVDPYIHMRRGYHREDNVDDDTHQRFYEHLRNVLHDMPGANGRYSFVREFSFAIPDIWRERQWGPPPKFVYHDANPSYGAVRTDLRAWWPLLAEDGIMGGRNYTGNIADGSVVGVRRAVDEFAAEHGLQVFTTNDGEPSWLLLKGAARATLT